MTGLTSLLLILAVTTGQIVLRTLRSASNIDASARAFYAAEAGVEDALYELSAHQAGYETANRKNTFGAENGPRWEGLWSIQSHTLEGKPHGVLSNNRKRVISLWSDTGTEIQNAPVGTLTLTLSAPQEVKDISQNGLNIDNDGDFLSRGVNEDGKNTQSGPCPGERIGLASGDDDCDGRIDEDSAEDVVVQWKLVGANGKTLNALPGCLTETDPGRRGTEWCEKDFRDGEATLQITGGRDESGTAMTLTDFLRNNASQLELLITSPLEAVTPDGRRKIPFTLNYAVETDAVLPDPFFTITADGWYRDIKQSITTVVVPQTTSPLFDFTVIQQ